MKRALYSLLLLPLLLFGETVVLNLEEHGFIRYTIENNLTSSIERLTCDSEVLYSHTYTYDENGRLLEEQMIGNLGTIHYNEDGSSESPYSFEKIVYDDQNLVISHTIDETETKYQYDKNQKLLSKPKSTYHRFDCQGNLIQLDNVFFEYDDDHHLTRAFSKDWHSVYEYDQQNRRVAKITNGKLETYTYLGNNIIGVHNEEHKLKALRIPGLFLNENTFRPIAIETEDAIYAPIHNFKGDIIKLVNIETREIIDYTATDPFGKGIEKNTLTPWIFSGKYFDSETGLVFFGDRYYCPDLHQWTTPDPEMQSFDPYEYCLGNPLSNYDPDGRFAWSLVLYTSAGWVNPIGLVVGGALLAKVGYDRYKTYKAEQRYLDMLQKRDQAIYEQHQLDKQDFNKRLKEVHDNIAELEKIDTYTQTEPFDEITNEPVDPHCFDTIQTPTPQLKWEPETLLLYQLLKNTSFEKEDDLFFPFMEQSGKDRLIDYTLPADVRELENNRDWRETTNPRAKHDGCNTRSFENITTGEKLIYDRGITGKPGHRGHDHFHRINPEWVKGNYNQYLDAQGNPVNNGSFASHLYSPKLVWWY